MAQANYICTAIRDLMSRGRPSKSTSPVRPAHTELVAALAFNHPHPIHIAAESDDLDGRADHLEKVLAAMRVYLTALLRDTAENVPGGILDCKHYAAIYADFCACAVGGIRNAAEKMREYETWRAS